MTRTRGVPALIAGTLLLICPAKAEYAPADTTAFVAYCADHFVDCRNEVRSVDNINRLIQAGVRVDAEHGCTFPLTEPAGGRLRTPEENVHDSTAATNAVLAWLKANSATRKPKTRDAINQAARVLWPANCK